MSSTNRGSDRHNDDFYRTPAWVTRAILPYVYTNGDRDILDPCCGDGAILDCFDEDRVLVGLELDADRAAQSTRKGHIVTQGDALKLVWPLAHLTITNPPFSLAEEFVRRAIAFALDNGSTVAMLLRLAFVESKKRKALHTEFPSDLFPLSERPSFTEDGGTDSCAYGWFVWDMHPAAVDDRKRNGGRIHILTDEAEKKPRGPRAVRPSNALSEAASRALADKRELVE